MSRKHRFIFPLPNGLHARPASHLEALANRYVSDVSLVNERTGCAANVKSVLSMVAADIKQDDSCALAIHGVDEEAAWEALTKFLQDTLPGCDQALPQLPAAHVELLLPRSLKAAGLQNYYRGTAVSAGIGCGRVVIADAIILPANMWKESPTEPRQEHARFASALTTVRAALEGRIATTSNAKEAAVLQAHLSIVRDVELAGRVKLLIAREGQSAAQAVVAAGEFFIATLQSAQSAYLRERALDVKDVCAQLLEAICARHAGHAAVVKLDGPSVCVAERLTPGQFLALDRRLLNGLVLRDGGTTSHTVILARSMGVPALVGVREALSALRPGEEVIVDANLGLLVTHVTEPVRRYYELEMRRMHRMNEALASSRRLPAATSDGRALEVGANVVSPEEVYLAIENGAQGIGLLRTEMLFVDRDAAPTEQEQLGIYMRSAEAAAGCPVIIRLLDIGGDKPAPYLNLPVEANPFLGNRGVRIYRDHSELVRTQLRAILRAAQSGDIRILVPMICCVEEVREVRQLLTTIREELASDGKICERVPPLGVMLEVPAAAFLVEDLCREVDFFSIGSNDLAQYFLAADRGNGNVADIYSWAHPSFLRLLKKIVDGARAGGKWIGLCGEMANSSGALPLLIALGLDEISLAPPRVPTVKRAVGALRLTDCTDLLERTLRCSTRAQVEALLDAFEAQGRTMPLLSPELLLLPAHGASKAEVIKELTDTLWLAGRTESPRLIEEVVWRREEVYSTGFGYGFAMPHCKSNDVLSNSIVLAKLPAPVDWGSVDTNAVDVVILLAIRSQDHEKQHMRIFGQLSRLVMRAEFRDRIRELDDRADLLKFLQQSLNVVVTAAA